MFSCAVENNTTRTIRTQMGTQLQKKIDGLCASLALFSDEQSSFILIDTSEVAAFTFCDVLYAKFKCKRVIDIFAIYRKLRTVVSRFYGVQLKNFAWTKFSNGWEIYQKWLTFCRFGLPVYSK